ncbi:hypothetical protein ONS95_007279 [Cadophora gregata]|uniref:uncharacterized protein n=1 Tax=Cadophora gregata TaxID=51156 RepID=UPI0026DACEBD|nr:uncharacterized protein ONS95_007279 [Cadophora gregata]KAK0100832.1 hypothetical protein ONS95_007279 [Cadophora gregata]KAK0117175.1 hypothetical protein ONS96_013008 [Cadophora gregata f. sp. sojae]
MPSISARDKVLALPELTAAIVIQLPINDILINAQRVSSKWKAAVDSLPVQQVLFFAPLPSDRGLKPQFNPLLAEKFPAWFKPTERKGSHRGSRGWKFEELEWGSTKEKCAAYVRKDASWRRMLPVQPPATIFEVRQASHYQMGSYLKVGHITVEDGVRMGTVYDWAQKTVTTPISDFQMKWHMAHPNDDAKLSFGMSADEMDTAEEFDRRAQGGGSPKVTMYTSYTMQCCVDMDPDVGSEFVSGGYEDLKLSWEEERVA